MRRLPILLVLFLMNCLWPEISVAQASYPDTTRWLGQWADEGELTYNMAGFVVIQENGDASGWFDWTMIYSPYREHRDLVGNTGRELLEGKYHKLSGILRLESVGLIQTVEIISGDKYILQLTNGGEKMAGRNFEPKNFKGSLYALRVPKSPPIFLPPPDPKITVGSKPIKVKPQVKEEDDAEPALADVLTVPADSAAEPPPIKDFSNRTVLTKDEIAVKNDAVRIEVWDKSIVDGDVISLELNGVIILQNYQVREKRKSLTLDLQPGENLLVMHAENLGRIPPNTAAIAIYQGKKSEVYMLNSDLGKSEAIRLLRK